MRGHSPRHGDTWMKFVAQGHFVNLGHWESTEANTWSNCERAVKKALSGGCSREEAFGQLPEQDKASLQTFGI